MSSRARLTLVVIAIACAMVSTTPAFADTALFSQLNANFESLLSDRNTTNHVVENAVYDNFSIPVNSTITSVDWSGERSRTATLSGFTISFYANDGLNQPGSLLYTHLVPGNAGEVVTGLDYFNHKNYFSADYSDPIHFSVSGGSKYWISIVGDVNETLAWTWQDAFDGDLRSFGRSAMSGDQRYIYDVAFTLNGHATPPPPAVPEPSSLLLTGSGILTLASMLRRRFPRPA